MLTQSFSAGTQGLAEFVAQRAENGTMIRREASLRLDEGRDGFDRLRVRQKVTSGCAGADGFVCAPRQRIASFRHFPQHQPITSARKLARRCEPAPTSLERDRRHKALAGRSLLVWCRPAQPRVDLVRAAPDRVACNEPGSLDAYASTAEERATAGGRLGSPVRPPDFDHPAVARQPQAARMFSQLTRGTAGTTADAHRLTPR